MSFHRQFSTSHPASRMDYSRKQSSADLQSRLKSRKILGVGVTGDGLDIHRSKLSQLLGTNDNIVNISKLPVGLNRWLQFMAISTAFFSIWSLLLPTSYQQLILNGGNGDGSPMYSVCLFSICLQLQAGSTSTNKSILQYHLLAAELILFFHTAGSLSRGVIASGLLFTSLLLVNTCYFLATLNTISKLTVILSKLFKEPRGDYASRGNDRSSPMTSRSVDVDDLADQDNASLNENKENEESGKEGDPINAAEVDTQPTPIKDSNAKKQE